MYYLRYVGDFVIFSNSRIELENWKTKIGQTRKSLIS